ncbi:GEF1 protein [Gigaspora margarita]|uniref:GEF1 protein n=1 Tax=Gigaspora margarita TaxID=4874 RepID=A0A8H4A6G8_GIGMA|nr:GEF1 protein [Gigaspora margarita]
MNPQYLPKSSERKRVNPLIDLVETEKIYISDLRCLLKRVTSCWSSEDLPPPELDTLFRAIEEIYKRNKQFYSKLAKYGTSPQSAEVLGDALMAWVDEMEEPYKNYCQKPRQGFNKREDIEENLVLQQTLNDISAENNQPVSLDYFFDIPIKRLHYYKKLYMRLFKSTEPGRSDHIILASANERIDQIIKLEKQVKQSYLKNPINSSQRLYPTVPTPSLSPSPSVEERAVTPTKDQGFHSSPEPEFHSPLLERLQQNQEHIITPTKDQGFHSNYSTVQEPEFHSPLPLRIQQDHIHSPMPQRLHSPISPMQDYESSFSGYFPETSEDSQSNWSILDLQNFIDTSRTFDILTKQPRKVNLVLQPPNLPFNREIVLYEDFVIEVPEYDSDERFHVRAHLFLLTDLLLVCQKIEPKDQKSISNFKYWLMYQPLSGKHLSIRDTSYEEGAMLELTIMRDETLIIYPQTDDVKDTWFREISNAIKFASVGSMRPQVNTDVKNLNSAGSSPRTLSPSPNTGVLTPNSSGSRSRSPTNSRLSPTNSRLSPTNSGLSPNNNNNMGHSPIGSRKPGLPTRPNQYLGTSNGRSQALDIQRKSSDESIYKPSNDNNNNNNNHNQIQQDRISDPSSPNSVYRSQSLNSLKRSNSISSLKSVASIAVMREKIFESSPCQIFYWINGNWKPLTTKDLCIVEVRVTTMNKGCWAILLQKTNRMILNAWIHSNTIIERNSPTTISISCEMGLNKEFYRVSMSIPEEADRFFANLNKVKQIPLENSNNLLLPPQGLISRSSSLQSLQRNDSLNREVEKSSKLAMECRCRLFLQNDHGIWTNLGWGKMQLEIESPSQRRKLVVNSEKQNKKLVDAILREDGVERVGRAGVAITLNSIDPANSKRIIYMMQMKEEAMAVKAYKIMKQGRY